MNILCLAKKPCQTRHSDRLAELLNGQCRRNGCRLELVWSEYHNHMYELVRNLDIGRFDRIVACGGDGTNYQMLNALLYNHEPASLPALAVLPNGRGNSFARDLDIFSFEDGFRTLFSTRTRPVDVCTFTQGQDIYYFVNLMGLGFITDVAARAAAFGILGDFSYVIGVIIETLGLHFHHITLTLDGKTYETENCFVEFCNSRFTGGTMIMAPEARIDDGFFDVVIASPLSRSSLLRTFPRIFRGSHVSHPAIEVIRAQHATVTCSPQKKLLPDGELFGCTPVEIGIKPGLVRYCL